MQPGFSTVPMGGQPGYGQPGYGQPGYGQPGYGEDMDNQDMEHNQDMVDLNLFINKYQLDKVLI